MFEYWFLNVRDSQDPKDATAFSHAGTTTDFLEFVCELTRMFDTDVTGKFIAALMEEKTHELDFLRITQWDFDYSIPDTDQFVRLVKQA